MNGRTLLRLILVSIGLLLAGLFVGATNQFMPTAASAEAQPIDALFNFMLVIATIIFLIVEGALLYSIIRFRKKPGDETDGPPIHGNTALELVWTAIPAVIVLGLSLYSFQVFADMQNDKDGTLVLHVKGQQFVWSFDYPHDPNVKLLSSSELHLPINVPIRMEIESADVMHGFWVPEFRIKQDAVPGRITEARFTPTLLGEYNVVCSELCGSGHGLMHNKVVVQSQADYDKFVTSLIEPEAQQPAPGEHNAAWGKHLILSNEYGCGGCHYLPDAGIAGQVGPTWVALADRAAGRVADEDAKTYLVNSILYPNKYVVSGYPANVMPQNFGQRMSDTDLNSIVDYLLQQTANPTANGTPAAKSP